MVITRDRDLRPADQLPAKACDLLGLEAPPASEDPYGSRAADQLMGYAEAGDAHRQRPSWRWRSPTRRST